MKIEILIILSIITITSCNVNKKTIGNNETKANAVRKPSSKQFVQDKNLFNIENNKFIGKDSLNTTHYLSGEIRTLGKLAIETDGDISNLKIDVFKVFYENGNLKEKGKYQIGRFTQCCTGGLCSQFYNYKLDEWEYYFEDGSRKANVVYKVNKFKIDTSCEEGDYIDFGQIDLEKSKFWNQLGDIIKPSNDLISDLETIVYIRGNYHSESLSIQNGKVKVELIVNEK